MTTFMTSSPTPPADLTPESVMAWLRAHPDFLKNHPDAIDFLTPAPERKKGGGVADFQHYLVKRLKEDRESVLNTSRDIIETARQNMNNIARIHAAVLRLLECPSFSEFIETITSDLATQLDVDVVALVIEADASDPLPHVHVPGIRMVPEGTITAWLAGLPILLQSDIGGQEAVFGGGAALVRSQALARIDISIESPPALLAFGSRDPHLFADGQGTEHILFLTRVIERLFRIWLQLPMR